MAESEDLEDKINRITRLLQSFHELDPDESDDPGKGDAAPGSPVDPTLCYVRRVPPEILLRVFEYCKFHDTDTSHPPWWRTARKRDNIRPLPTILALSQVCRTWRHITNAHGYLWAEILVDSEKRTRLYIERSRDAWLHLAFNPFSEYFRHEEEGELLSEEHFKAALCVMDTLERVRDIDLCGPVNAETLDILFIAGRGPASDYFNRRLAELDMNDASQLIPVPKMLRTLAVRDFSTDKRLRLFHAPLTSLSLTRTCCGNPRLTEAWRLVSPLVEILCQLPALEHLSVTVPIYPIGEYELADSKAPNPIKAPLSNLRTLNVQDELPLALSLIESLDTPPNLKLSLISEAWGDYDRDDLHESAPQIPSYDPRLRDILEAQYAAACTAGARFTRLNITDSREPVDTIAAVAIELCDPSSHPLPESVILTMDCEMYTSREGRSQCLLRLFPSLPLVDGIRTLGLYVDLNEEGWKETSRWLTAATHVTVSEDLTLDSLLRADQTSEKLLFPRLQRITLDDCVPSEAWDDFNAFLRRREDKSGHPLVWEAIEVSLAQTKQEEQELLDWMSAEGFAPQKWCRPSHFEYEAVPRSRGVSPVRFLGTSLR